MIFPEKTKKVLLSNIKFCFEENLDKSSGEFVVTEDDKNWFVDNLGIKNRESAFSKFYTVVAIPIIGDGSELSTLESIINNSEQDSNDSDMPSELGNRYLRFTSYEGEGAYFFDVETDEVFDVDWGFETDLVDRKLKPIAASFFDFLEGYYRET